MFNLNGAQARCPGCFGLGMGEQQQTARFVNGAKRHRVVRCAIAARARAVVVVLREVGLDDVVRRPQALWLDQRAVGAGAAPRVARLDDARPTHSRST